MRFSDGFIQRVRDGSDIVRVIGEYVRLKRRGNNYVGLCPFHNEKTPSFSVSQDSQLYHCFGCGVGGNVFTFVMEQESLGFAEAVRHLAEKAGIPIEEEEVSPAQKQRQETMARLWEVAELAAKYYAYQLEKAVEAAFARKYTAERGISQEAVRGFSLGYAKPNWDDLLTLLKSRGYSENEVVQAGLALPRKDSSGYYDRFRNRLMFPIKDSRGRTVAFGGRALDQEESGPKYLNSPESEIFSKGSHLYGLDQAKAALRKGEPAIITEGYMDVIALHSSGFSSAVASLGTSLTEGQARLLSRFTSKVVIAYDGDSAGEAATWRGLEVLGRYGLEIKVLVLPSGEDPDSYVRSAGPEALREILARAMPLTDYKIERSLAGFDLRQVNDRVKAARSVLPVLTDISGAVAREAYLELVARKIGISTGSLKRELAQYENRLRKDKNADRNIFPENRNNISGSRLVRPETPGAGPQSQIELAALKLFLHRPELVVDMLTEENIKYFLNPTAKEILLAIIETSASGAPLAPAEMMDRFENEDVKKLFSQLIFSEELSGSVENPQDCMAKLRIHYFQEELKDLIQNLVNIRNSGQVTEINRLTVEYIQLYKEVQSVYGERGER